MGKKMAPSDEGIVTAKALIPAEILPGRAEGRQGGAGKFSIAAGAGWRAAWGEAMRP